MGLALALLAWSGAGAQDDRDEEAVKFPAEAERHCRLALWEPAERVLRELLDKGASDALRWALANVLYRARKYDECMRECELAAGSKDPGVRSAVLALKGACAWKKGDGPGARTWCEQALHTADERGANSYPAVRRMVRSVLAFMEWKRHESAHVVVHCPEDSPLAKDIVSFAARLDAAFEKAAAALGASVDGKIEAYYFSDQRQADAILGVPLNHTVPRERAYYALHDASLGHALAHVVSFYAARAKEKERPRSAFLNEGFACAFSFEPLWERRLREVPATLLRQEKLEPLPELLRRSGSGVDFAAAGGSFVRWLIGTGGRERFARLWTEYNDHADPWTAVYGRPVEDLDAAWRASLKR